MNLVFASDSIWNWEAERTFAILEEQNSQLVQAARGRSVVDEENPKKGRQSGGGGDGCGAWAWNY